MAAGAHADYAQSAEACYESCEEHMGTRFIMCMSQCRACADVCKGLEGEDWTECTNRCGEVVKAQILEASAGTPDLEIAIRRVIILYELRNAIMRMQSLCTSMAVSLDPVFGEYIGRNSSEGEFLAEYNSTVSFVEDLLEHFAALHEDEYSEVSQKLQSSWKDFRSYSEEAIERLLETDVASPDSDQDAEEEDAPDSDMQESSEMEDFNYEDLAALFESVDVDEEYVVAETYEGSEDLPDEIDEDIDLSFEMPLPIVLKDNVSQKSQDALNAMIRELDALSIKYIKLYVRK
jgi:hypothetical protein